MTKTEGILTKKGLEMLLDHYRVLALECDVDMLTKLNMEAKTKLYAMQSWKLRAKTAERNFATMLDRALAAEEERAQAIHELKAAKACNLARQEQQASLQKQLDAFKSVAEPGMVVVVDAPFGAGYRCINEEGKRKASDLVATQVREKSREGSSPSPSANEPSVRRALQSIREYHRKQGHVLSTEYLDVTLDILKKASRPMGYEHVMEDLESMIGNRRRNEDKTACEALEYIYKYLCEVWSWK